ncbi:MAG: peptidoglycan-binding protein [Acidobacteriota bacterium]|nr:peptidoglycan-binding protein [Acidobacteriota bacterium]
MFSFRSSLALTIALVLAAAPACAVAASSKKHSRTHHRTHHSRRSHRIRGQQEIQPERVTQIQQALANAHYLDEEPNGEWDASTKSAMQKYQSDNGWQTRLMPDARALVKLGLGPDYSDAINAKGSSFAAPPPDSTIPQTQEAGFAAAAGVSSNR